MGEKSCKLVDPLCENCTSFDHDQHHLEEQCAVALSLYTMFGIELGKGCCSEWWLNDKGEK